MLRDRGSRVQGILTGIKFFEGLQFVVLIDPQEFHARADHRFFESVLLSKSLFFRKSGRKTVATFPGIALGLASLRPPGSPRRSRRPPLIFDIVARFGE